MIKRDPHPANQEEEKYHGYWGEVHMTLALGEL